MLGIASPVLGGLAMTKKMIEGIKIIFYIRNASKGPGLK